MRLGGKKDAVMGTIIRGSELPWNGPGFTWVKHGMKETQGVAWPALYRSLSVLFGSCYSVHVRQPLALFLSAARPCPPPWPSPRSCH